MTREVVGTATVALVIETPEHLRSEWALAAPSLVMADLRHHAAQEEWWLDAVAENAGLRAVRAAKAGLL